MVVVSDTSPLTALLLAGRESLLPSLFDRVVIPPAVEAELRRVHPVLPAWLETLAPCSIPSDVIGARLDPGETEAISLALEMHPDTLLIDERLGRRFAVSRGLRVTGLLGLVVLAKRRNLIQAAVPLIHELQDKGSCWFGHDLLVEVCQAADEIWR